MGDTLSKTFFGDGLKQVYHSKTPGPATHAVVLITDADSVPTSATSTHGVTQQQVDVNVETSVFHYSVHSMSRPGSTSIAQMANDLIMELLNWQVAHPSTVAGITFITVGLGALVLKVILTKLSREVKSFAECRLLASTRAVVFLGRRRTSGSATGNNDAQSRMPEHGEGSGSENDSVHGSHFPDARGVEKDFQTSVLDEYHEYRIVSCPSECILQTDAPGNPLFDMITKATTILSYRAMDCFIAASSTLVDGYAHFEDCSCSEAFATEPWRKSQTLNDPLLRAWYNGDGSDVIWLHGSPGAGKTSTAMNILCGADRCMYAATAPTTAHFFFGRSKRHGIPAIFRALRSLMLQLEHAKDKSTFDKAVTPIANAISHPWTLSASVWTEILTRSISNRRLPAYLIIDGLDQCEPSDQSMFLEILRTLGKTGARSLLRILITSRLHNEKVHEDDGVLFLSAKDSFFTQCNLSTHSIGQPFRCNRMVLLLLKLIVFSIRPLKIIELQEATLRMTSSSMRQDCALLYDGHSIEKSRASFWNTVKDLVHNVSQLRMVKVERHGAGSEWLPSQECRISLEHSATKDSLSKMLLNAGYDESRHSWTELSDARTSSAAKGLWHLKMAQTCLSYLTATSKRPPIPKATTTNLSTRHPLFNYASSSWLSHIAAANAEDLHEGDFREHLSPQSWIDNFPKDNTEITSKSNKAVHILVKQISRRAKGMFSWVKLVVTTCARAGLDKPTVVWLADPRVSSVFSEKDRASLLSHATVGGSSRVIECLLQAGVDVNGKDGLGSTPLCSATYAPDQKASAEVARMLINHGAKIHEPSQGMTPVHHAARNGHLEILKVLLESGADLGATFGCTYHTPLYLASSHGHITAVEALLKAGSDPNFSDGVTGLRPLHFALLFKSKQMVALLITSGALLELCNEQYLPKAKVQWMFRLSLLLMPRQCAGSQNTANHAPNPQSSEIAGQGSRTCAVPSSSSFTSRPQSAKRSGNDGADDDDEGQNKRRRKAGPKSHRDKSGQTQVACPYAVHPQREAALDCRRLFSDGNRLKEHLWTDHMLTKCPYCEKSLWNSNLDRRKHLHYDHPAQCERGHEHDRGWGYVKGFAFEQVRSLNQRVTGTDILEKFRCIWAVLFPDQELPSENQWIFLPGARVSLANRPPREEPSIEIEEATVDHEHHDIPAEQAHRYLTPTGDRSEAFQHLQNQLAPPAELSPVRSEAQTSQPNPQIINNTGLSAHSLSSESTDLDDAVALIQRYLARNPSQSEPLRQRMFNNENRSAHSFGAQPVSEHNPVISSNSVLPTGGFDWTQNMYNSINPYFVGGPPSGFLGAPHLDLPMEDGHSASYLDSASYIETGSNMAELSSVTSATGQDNAASGANPPGNMPRYSRDENLRPASRSEEAPTFRSSPGVNPNNLQYDWQMNMWRDYDG